MNPVVLCYLCEQTGHQVLATLMLGGGRGVCRDHGQGALLPMEIERLNDREIESLKTNGSDLVEQALARHAGDLTPEEIQIARVIGRRVGQSAAIRIADLIRALGGGYTDRDIKAMVERLRHIAKLQIAATKVPPYGYFVPATDAEGREFFDRHVREAVKHLRVAQLFHGDRDLMQELRGQLGLQETEVRSQESEGSEAR